MSWFSGPTLPNISTPSKYYFIPEVYEKDFFRIYYAETVKVDDKKISTPKRGIYIIAVSKDQVSIINPAKDFTFAVTVTFNGKTYKFSQYPLSNILTDETSKHSQYLTHAILSCGEPCLDLDQEILIIPGMIAISKFTDSKVIDKLNKALNEAFWNNCHHSQFDLEDEKSEFHISVSVQLSSSAIEKLKEKMIGPFLLPELTGVAKVSCSPDLLIKSVIMNQAAEVNSESDSE